MDRVTDKEICEFILSAFTCGDLPSYFDTSFVSKMYAISKTTKLTEKQYCALENIVVKFKLGKYAYLKNKSRS